MPSLPPIFITTQSLEEAVVVRVAGEVDMASVHRLEDAIEAAYAQGRTTLLDLSGVEFMDSTGLKLLLTTARHSGDWEWFIVRPSSPVARLIEASGTEALLPVATTDPRDAGQWVGAA